MEPGAWLVSFLLPPLLLCTAPQAKVVSTWSEGNLIRPTKAETLDESEQREGLA